MSNQERLAFVAAMLVCDDDRHEPDKRLTACNLILKLRGDELPANARAAYHAYRGNAYREIGKREKAMDDYEVAIKTDPLGAEGYGGRALLHRTFYKQAEAIADANKAVELEPENLRWLGTRAMVLAEQAPEKALADIERVLALMPNGFGALAIRASILIELGKYDGAVSDAMKALELNPNFAEALAIRCLARAAQGKPAEAAPDCDLAASRLPKSVMTRTNRGITFVLLQKYVEAIDELDEALDIDEMAPSALYARGIAKQRNGNASSGKRDIDKAVAVDPAIAGRLARWGIAP